MIRLLRVYWNSGNRRLNNILNGYKNYCSLDVYYSSISVTELFLYSVENNLFN